MNHQEKGPLAEIRGAMSRLDDLLCRLPDNPSGAVGDRKYFLEHSENLMARLKEARALLLPYQVAPIEISLGSPEAIARFFALQFILKDKLPLESVTERPFSGSGVYAIYSSGDWEPAYVPLSHSETPIYIGKADPKTTYAPDSESQGQALYLRLREHAKNMRRANLDLKNFTCRTAVIQSGMQYSVENFLIHLFKPIWNKEVGICHGLGKHGDSAKTRANRRSPWDTMHPGREWADGSASDQTSRDEIVAKIETHFANFPPIGTRDELINLLTSPA